MPIAESSKKRKDITMNILYIGLIGITTFLLGFVVSRLLNNKGDNIKLPQWTNKDLDSTIVTIGMLIIFGGFVEQAEISNKDVFTRLVELFNGVWLLILGFLFGKISNGDNGKGHHDTSQSTDNKRTDNSL